MPPLYRVALKEGAMRSTSVDSPVRRLLCSAKCISGTRAGCDLASAGECCRRGHI